MTGVQTCALPISFGPMNSSSRDLKDKFGRDDMKLFNLFGKKTDAPPQKTEDDEDELEIYSGMRVEVTAMDGRMLFVAKLMGLHGSQAELHQYSEAAFSQETLRTSCRKRPFIPVWTLFTI